MRNVRTLLVLLSVIGLLAAGCGDDDGGDDEAAEDETTEQTGGGGGDQVDVDQFCQDAVAVEAAFAPEEPDPQEVQAALEQAQSSAPEEVQDDVSTIVELLPQIGDEGPPPEFEEAARNIDEFLLAECGFEEIEVSGVDFAFDGVPEQLEAGTYAFNFTNDAAEEFHVLALVRINDDVTESFEEILQLPEEQAQSNVTDVGGTAADPGGSDVFFVDLEPGRYGVLCPIPVGTIGDTEGTGPPHFVEGMFAEFEVT